MTISARLVLLFALALRAWPVFAQPFLPVTSAIDVISYDVELAVPELRRVPVDARVEIELRALQTISAVRLNIEPSKIALESVRNAAGSPLQYSIEPGQPNAHGLTGSVLVIALRSALAAGASTTVAIDYRAEVQPATDQRGFFFTPAYHGSAVLTTRSWPYYARYWLPSNDHPWDAATFRFTVTVPPGVVVAANGDFVGSSVTAEGIRHVWEQNEPIPTYAAQVIAGDLVAQESVFCYDVQSGAKTTCAGSAIQMPALFVYPASLTNRSRYETQITRATDALAYFSAAFGPYQFAKAGFAAAPHPFSMESASLAILVRPDDAVHEVIHHWWGDSVRIATWGDFWISEGLTTYFTGFYDEVRTGTNTACMVRNRKLSVDPGHDPMDQFNTDPYCIGAAAIHDFREWLSAELELSVRNPQAMTHFLRVFRLVYQDLAFEPVGTRGFTRALSTATLQVLQSAGSERTSAEVDLALMQWEREWFEGLPEIAVRRRAVRR